jgi:hypothetical protein
MDALGMTMSLRTESLDADASNVSEATPRATRKRAREAIFARFDQRAGGAQLAKRRGKKNCVELELEALGRVSDETIAKFARYGEKMQKMMQKVTRRGGGATPRLEPTGYAARGTLFNEPYRVSVDDRGVHRVVWGKEGESRRVVRSKDGARTPQEAVECVHLEILRRMHENIPSVSDESQHGYDGKFEVRMCSNCRRDCSKTPLMRRGPDGIGTLCNACGLWYSRHATMRKFLEVPEETPRKAIFIRNPVKSRRALKTLDVFGYHSSIVQSTLSKACAAVIQEENGSLPRPRGTSKRDSHKTNFKQAIDNVFDRYDFVFTDSPSNSDGLCDDSAPSMTEFTGGQLEELEGIDLEELKAFDCFDFGAIA